MISQQNTRLGFLGADLRTGGIPDDAARERELIELSRSQRMKPTCTPDDGSNAGPWVYVPAPDVDGDHRYTRVGSGVYLTQFERETDNV